MLDNVSDSGTALFRTNISSPSTIFNDTKRIAKPVVRQKHPCAIICVWDYEDKYYDAVPCMYWVEPQCMRIKHHIKRKAINEGIENWDRFNMTHVVHTLGDPADVPIMIKASNRWYYNIKRGLKRGVIYKDTMGKFKKRNYPARPDFDYVRTIEVQLKRFEKRLTGEELLYKDAKSSIYKIHDKIPNIKNKKLRTFLELFEESGEEKFYTDIKFIKLLEKEFGREIIKDAIVIHLHTICNYRLVKKDIFPLWTKELKRLGSKSDFNYCECTWPIDEDGKQIWNTTKSGDYLSKYFTKDNCQYLIEAGFDTGKKIRRFTCSRKKDKDGVMRNLIPTDRDLKFKRKIKMPGMQEYYDEKLKRIRIYKEGKEKVKAIRQLEQEIIDSNKRIKIPMFIEDGRECKQYFEQHPNTPRSYAFYWELKTKRKRDIIYPNMETFILAPAPAIECIAGA